MDRVMELLDSAAKRKSLKVVAHEIYPDNKLESAISRLGNELAERDTYKLGLRTAIKILQITGDLSALDRIEGMFNRVAFSVPEPDPESIKPIMELVSKLAKEFGENMAELAEAMADGRIKPKEARNCLKENKDLITVCLQVQAYLEQFVK